MTMQILPPRVRRCKPISNPTSDDAQKKDGHTIHGHTKDKKSLSKDYLLCTRQRDSFFFFLLSYHLSLFLALSNKYKEWKFKKEIKSQKHPCTPTFLKQKSQNCPSMLKIHTAHFLSYDERQTKGLPSTQRCTREQRTYKFSHSIALPSHGAFFLATSTASSSVNTTNLSLWQHLQKTTTCCPPLSQQGIASRSQATEAASGSSAMTALLGGHYPPICSCMTSDVQPTLIRRLVILLCLLNSANSTTEDELVSHCNSFAPTSAREWACKKASFLSSYCGSATGSRSDKSRSLLLRSENFNSGNFVVH